MADSRSHSKPRNFVTLDLLRGVAAIPIMHIHTARLYGLGEKLPNHSLAVDFFLMLSGFMMSYVYQERLDAGWSTADFLRTRFLRLYPLYAIGTLVGVAFAVLWARFGRLSTSGGELAVLAVLGLLFIPAPPPPLLPTASVALYPFNVPTWTLFYQLVANLVHAVALRRRSFKTIAGLAIAFGAIVFTAAIHNHGQSYGPDRSQYPLAFCRCLFAYLLGIILYRLWSMGYFRAGMHPLLVAAAFFGVLAVPVPAPLQGVYACVAVAVLLPLVLLLGANARSAGLMSRVSKWVGGLSFPLYVLHVPLFQFFEQAWVKIVKHPIAQDAPWSGLVYLALLLPAGFVLGELYDPEARKLLHMRILPAASRLFRMQVRRPPVPVGPTA